MMVKGGLAALVVLSLSHMVPPVEIMRMLVILVTSGMLMNISPAMKHQMIGKICSTVPPLPRPHLAAVR